MSCANGGGQFPDHALDVPIQIKVGRGKPDMRQPSISQQIVDQPVHSAGRHGNSPGVIRAGLAKLTSTDGLLGMSKRTPDREAVKPYLFVHAKAGKWEVLHTPAVN